MLNHVLSNKIDPSYLFRSNVIILLSTQIWIEYIQKRNISLIFVSSFQHLLNAVSLKISML